MTGRISVTLPDDVAEFLSAQPNASAAVAEAVRLSMNRTRMRDRLRAIGLGGTDEEHDGAREYWRRRFAETDPMPPEVIAAGQADLDALGYVPHARRGAA